MIIDAVLGNVHDAAGRELVGSRSRDEVLLASADLRRRISRLRTASGRQLGLRLPSGSPDLKDGDVLCVDPDGRPEVVVVRVEPSDVLVIRPSSIRQMGQVAHALGNRHLQAQFFDESSDYGAQVMVVPYDHTVVDLLVRHDVPHDRQQRVLQVPFRHAEHTH